MSITMIRNSNWPVRSESRWVVETGRALTVKYTLELQDRNRMQVMTVDAAGSRRYMDRISETLVSRI